MKWFRLWVDILDDHKIAQLNDYEFRVFIDLMALTSEQDAINGRLTWDLTAINRRLRRRYDHLKRAVETFQKVGLITVDDGGLITITNWNKRQFKSDDVYSRVKKHRETTAIRNVTVTANETVPDTDSDTDTDTYNKNPPLPPKGKEVILPEWLAPEIWQKYRDHRKAMKSKMTDVAEGLAIAKLTKFKEYGHDPVAVINQSIEMGWKGLFEIKSNGIEKPAPADTENPFFCKTCQRKRSTMARLGRCVECERKESETFFKIGGK